MAVGRGCVIIPTRRSLAETSDGTIPSLYLEEL